MADSSQIDKDMDVNSPDEPILDHNYDGIREADNPLPRWWVNMFLVTTVFAFVYFPVVHMFGFLPRQELQAAIQTANDKAAQIEAERMASGYYDKDPVAAGEKYFKVFCATCHGVYGEGGVCPNLTDSHWIHGPRTTDIIRTISEGVAAKGMPTWRPILGDRKIQMIAAYVSTLWQTTPPTAGKKAEGTEYDMRAIRESDGSKSDSASVQADVPHDHSSHM